ncbi:MAG: hypothetical protein LBG73_11215 [Spirochaetaceae bacterium]|jgi:hypothetical protein|nr:hypothetical protein [Spirochaetaceae bacterium]
MNWEDSITDIFEISLYENAERCIRGLDTVAVKDIVGFFKTTFPAGEKDAYFEYFTHSRWRKFLLSAYYADLASYAKKEDQTDFSRLCYILNKFPEGFTVWWISARNALYPAGYTGWHYVEEDTFDRLTDMQYRITNRFFPPAPSATPYIYLFNYSIAPALNHSEYSRILIKDYVSVISEIPYTGIFCAAVSADGVSVAERFGMNAVRKINNGDTIYILRKR